MKTPPLLTAATLAIWAWQTGFWFFGIVIALILEASRLIETRWDFSLSDFKRIADSCTIIFVIMAVYLMFSTSPSKIIFTLLQWLPISFFPLIFAQTYSVKNRIDIRVLSLVSRRQKNFGPKPPSSINISYPYLMTVVLAASIANVRTPEFYNALFILGVWALFSVRSRRLPFLFWVMIVIFAGFSGYAGHIGLHRLQVFIEDKGMDWYMDAMRGTADPFKSITAIGDIGTLKLGNRV
ncbi:hypothetical protein QUF76_18075, partial [Desulfobacterales bacterium HSG16]|nr:hypothetical protein [Desulfobacterales bacterium HSG16]